MRVEVSEVGGSHLPNSVTMPNKRQQLPATHDRTNRTIQADVLQKCGDSSIITRIVMNRRFPARNHAFAARGPFGATKRGQRSRDTEITAKAEVDESRLIENRDSSSGRDPAG